MVVSNALDALVASLDRMAPCQQDRVARQIAELEQRDPRHWLPRAEMESMIRRAATILQTRGGVTR